MGSLIHLVVVGLYPYLVINSSYLINDTLPHAVVAFQDNVCTQFPRSVNWFLKLFFGCLLKQAVKLRAKKKSMKATHRQSVVLCLSVNFGSGTDRLVFVCAGKIKYMNLKDDFLFLFLAQ